VLLHGVCVCVCVSQCYAIGFRLCTELPLIHPTSWRCRQGSLLWHALNDGNPDAVDALLTAKYDVNLRHHNCETPLHLVRDCVACAVLCPAARLSTCVVQYAAGLMRILGHTRELFLECIFVVWMRRRQQDGENGPDSKQLQATHSDLTAFDTGLRSRPR
jgi:hypothetical protein